MLERWFLAHPRSLNESYLEHQACALRFSFSLFAAAGACLVHALIPGLFERTASRMVESLHRDMATRRQRHLTAEPRPGAPSATFFRSDA
jgi:hypothetical protein